MKNKLKGTGVLKLVSLAQQSNSFMLKNMMNMSNGINAIMHIVMVIPSKQKFGF